MGRNPVTWLGSPTFPNAARDRAGRHAAARQPRARHHDHPHEARGRGRRAARLGAAAPGRRGDQGRRAVAFGRLLDTAGGVGHRARRASCTGPGTPPRPTRSCSASSGTRARGEVVKVKSMATAEIGLNEALEAGGVTAIETDLAELIVQLGDDRPSHILVPAIHRNRSEIRDIFRATHAARAHGVRPAGRARRGGPGAPAPQVPLREGRHLRRQLRGRRHRVGRGGGVRGQRADVPDAAGDADHRDGHREARADLAGPRGVPAAAAALVDGGADEPVHVGVDRA